jgi:alternate signal-mediated exported protein
MTTTTKPRPKTWLAAGAGAALLLGTGATFATWTAQDTVTGGTITTGRLAVTADELAWTDISPDGSGATVDIEDFELVPGDVLQGRTSVHTELAGTNLRADLSLGHAGDLPEWLAVDVSFEDAPEGGTVPVDASGTVPLVVTVELPVEETQHMTERIDLGMLTVTLSQVRPLA